MNGVREVAALKGPATYALAMVCGLLGYNVIYKAGIRGLRGWILDLRLGFGTHGKSLKVRV